MVVRKEKSKIKAQIFSIDDPAIINKQDHRRELTFCEEYFKEENGLHRENLLRLLMKFVGEEIKRLPESQRDVLIRFYTFSEPDSVIAKTLGRNKRSILDRRHRAIATLKKRLRDNPYVADILEELEDTAYPGSYTALSDLVEKIFSQ